jgi:aminoglycoside phosphotransferase family enzyme/predicted kinase
MDLPALLEALSVPAAYPHAVDAVAVRQTHISVVFLAGTYVYKLKKPVNLGFLDFSSLEKRRHFCEEEVRLNRRLAPHVYLGVMPITLSAGKPVVEGAGDAVEWAVKMVRLPDEATLLHRLRRDELEPRLLDELAQRLARFHATAEGGPRVAAFGRFDVVARNVRENFEQAAAQIGITISQAVFDRLRGLFEEELTRRRDRIGERADRGVPRDTHGDLHLDHINLFPERPPPDDLAIIDCIEFNERFRFADPVADMAFLVMDLAFQGRRDLATTFAAAYFRASGDAAGRELLPLYVAYRAAVRGKVEGFKHAEKEVPDDERAAARSRARAHWLLALDELEQPGRKPCLLLVAGLPGSGKSTLARGLAGQAGFSVIRSDVVRKELAGAAREDIYTAEWTDRTYAECLRRMEEHLFEGKRVLVDANFRVEPQRLLFLRRAQQLGVPRLFLHCRASPEIIRARLANRRGDASDADWAVHVQAAQEWQEPGPEVQRATQVISTDGTEEAALTQALNELDALEKGQRS